MNVGDVIWHYTNKMFIPDPQANIRSIHQANWHHYATFKHKMCFVAINQILVISKCLPKVSYVHPFARLYCNMHLVSLLNLQTFSFIYGFYFSKQPQQLLLHFTSLRGRSCYLVSLDSNRYNPPNIRFQITSIIRNYSFKLFGDP